MKLNINEWISEVLNSPERIAFPLAYYPGLELVGKNVLDVVTDPEAQSDVMAAVAERCPTTAGITNAMDLTVEAQAFGSEVEFFEDDPPQIDTPILTDRESAERLEVPSVNDARVPLFVKNSELAVKKITTIPVFPEILGPYSVASLLFGLKPTIKKVVFEPETVHIVLDKCARFLIEYAETLKETGVNGIILAEPTAGLLSPKQCHEFSSEYIVRLVDAVQDDSFMVILHNCGYAQLLVETMLSTGAKMLHFGNIVDIAGDIMPEIPEGILGGGNLDPVNVFKNGTPENVKKRTLQLLEDTKDFKNFIVSSGCDIPPGTPIENMDAFFEAVEEFNAGNS